MTTIEWNCEEKNRVKLKTTSFVNSFLNDFIHCIYHFDSFKRTKYLQTR